MVGTSGVSANSATLDSMTESGPGGSPYSSPGDLSSVGRAAAKLAVGHRFESDRFHATSSRALHKTGALAATCFCEKT